MAGCWIACFSGGGARCNTSLRILQPNARPSHPLQPKVCPSLRLQLKQLPSPRLHTDDTFPLPATCVQVRPLRLSCHVVEYPASLTCLNPTLLPTHFRFHSDVSFLETSGTLSPTFKRSPTCVLFLGVLQHHSCSSNRVLLSFQTTRIGFVQDIWYSSWYQLQPSKT